MKRQNIENFFKGFGLSCFILVLLVLIDQASYLLYFKYLKAPGSLAYPMNDLKRAYPRFSEKEIKDLLGETWTRKLRYHPYVQFVEREFKGKYVNVDENGIRSCKIKNAWPPDSAKTNVFIFGGSTAFGCGVADTQTIPSCLGGLLGDRFAVYNMGCGHYFDVQERLLFENLAFGGHVPDIAVFIDGINMFDQGEKGPYYSEALSGYFDSHRGWSMSLLLGYSFTAHAVSAVLKRLSGEKDAFQFRKAVQGARSLKRYSTNMAAVQRTAEALGVRTLFVLQPSPRYFCDKSANPFIEDPAGEQSPYKEGYELFDEKYTSGELKLPAPFLDLSKIQKDKSGILYVDAVHYTAAFSREIADSIARQILRAENGETQPR